MRKSVLLFMVLLLALCGAHAQEKLANDAQIPIVAWYGIPAAETTVARYQEMKDAGITYQLNGFSNINEMQKALDVAAKVGIKLIVSCPELKSDPENTVKHFMNHPAVAGYHLMDEPSIGLFPDLAAWAKKIQAVDNKHFCYVNLFPNVVDSVTLGTSDYPKYVRDCADLLPLQFMSFDYYPVLKDGLAESWFQNLETVADVAKKAGKPF